MSILQQIIFKLIFSYGIYDSVKMLYRKSHNCSLRENDLPSVGPHYRLAAIARPQNEVPKNKRPKSLNTSGGFSVCFLCFVLILAIFAKAHYSCKIDPRNLEFRI